MIFLKKYIIFIFSLFFLSGCFGGSEQEKLIEEGMNAYIKGDNKTAYEYLSQASRMGEFDKKTEEAFISVQGSIYMDYVRKGHEHRKELDYEKALEYYDFAFSMSSQAEDLRKAREETIELLKKQKNFNEYLNFFSDIMQESNALLNSFNEEVNDLYMGTRPIQQFNRSIKDIINESKILVTENDSILFINSDDNQLLDIQKKFMSYTREQHDLFLSAMSVVDSEENKKEVERVLKNYSNLKIKQRNLIVELQTYARDNLLSLNNDINETEEILNEDNN